MPTTLAGVAAVLDHVSAQCSSNDDYGDDDNILSRRRRGIRATPYPGRLRSSCPISRRRCSFYEGRRLPATRYLGAGSEFGAGRPPWGSARRGPRRRGAAGSALARRGLTE